MGALVLLSLLTVVLAAGAFSVGGDAGPDPEPEPQDPDRVIEGTARAEALTGGDGDDLLFGRAGNDTLIGGLGVDTLVGDLGDDELRGGFGDDLLIGQAGNDHLMGFDGDDRLIGGADDDRLFGAEGRDLLIGVAGSNVLDGGNGNDVIDGRDYGDTFVPPQELQSSVTNNLTLVFGAEAASTLAPRVIEAMTGGFAEGPDTLAGGRGDDLLIGDRGDLMSGGAGTDAFVVEYDGFADYGLVNIGDFDPTTERLEIRLIGPIPQGPLTFTDLGGGASEVRIGDLGVATLFNVDHAALASADIFVTGGTAPPPVTDPGLFLDGDVLGSAILEGGALNDLIIGRAAGTTTLAGGTGDDVLRANGAGAVALGDVGNDILIGDGTAQQLAGGAGNDLMIGGREMAGEGGDDLLIGLGSSVFDGGIGDDTLIGFDPIGTLRSEFVAGAIGQLDAAILSAYPVATPDQIGRATGGLPGVAATLGPDLLLGGAGNDLLLGDGGDTLEGGAGLDTFRIMRPDGVLSDPLAIIADFNAAEDRLEILLEATTPRGPVTISGPVGTQVVSVGGVQTAVVFGATAAIDPASVIVLNGVAA